LPNIQVNDQAAAIVRSVLGLGRALGLPVLAEGVETAAEFEFLEKEKCDEAQGCLLMRPTDIAIFTAVINGDTPAEPDAVVVPMPHKTSAVSLAQR